MPSGHPGAFLWSPTPRSRAPSLASGRSPRVCPCYVRCLRVLQQCPNLSNDCTNQTVWLAPRDLWRGCATAGRAVLPQYPGTRHVSLVCRLDGYSSKRVYQGDHPGAALGMPIAASTWSAGIAARRDRLSARPMVLPLVAPLLRPNARSALGSHGRPECVPVVRPTPGPLWILADYSKTVQTSLMLYIRPASAVSPVGRSTSTSTSLWTGIGACTKHDKHWRNACA